MQLLNVLQDIEHTVDTAINRGLKDEFPLKTCHFQGQTVNWRGQMHPNAINIWLKSMKNHH